MNSIHKILKRILSEQNRHGRVLQILLAAFLFNTLNADCQEIIRPNFAMKSHETLEILKIVRGDKNTTLFFSIENRIAGGSFCTDRNTWIVCPDGTRLRMTEASGIPVCPETYNFKTAGEKLFFALVFPPVKKETTWIDIVEECSQDCFRFYGVTLDILLNERLNEVFVKAAQSAPAEDILLFRKLLESMDDSSGGIKPLLYINIIKAAAEAGDRVEAEVWYRRFRSSGLPRLDHYIKYLDESGIRY